MISLYFIASVVLALVVYLFANSRNSRKSSGGTNAIQGKPLPALSAGKMVQRLVSRLVNRNQEQYLQEDFISLYRTTGHPIYSINVLIFKIVVCNDFETIRQLLLSESCSDRVIDRSVLLRTFNGKEQGILSNNGESLKEIRRYTVKTLGQMGFNSKTKGIADIVQEQVPELFEYIDSLIECTGNKVPVKELFSLSVVNVVWAIAGGEQFTRDNEKIIELMNISTSISQLTHLDLGILNGLAPLIVRFPKLFKYDRVIGATEMLKQFFVDLVNERIEVGDYKNNPPKDFIDNFLLEIDKYKNDNKFSEIYSFENLVMVLVDLFTAGKDTTSNSLEAAVMFMIKYPNVQKRIQKEIDTVVGKNGKPSFADHRTSMPYTMAAILEIHRMLTVSPLAPRAAGSDGLITDYIVPKGSWIIVNLWALHMDSKFWGDPHVFRPERFLDAENNFIRSQVNHIMPFGGGIRVCIGETVANLSLFTFFTSILQRYNIEKWNENEKLKLIFPLTSCPLPFHVKLSLRS